MTEYTNEQKAAIIEARNKAEALSLLLKAREDVMKFHLDCYRGGRVYASLMHWAREELEEGSRVKANKISQVAERLKWRRCGAVEP